MPEICHKPKKARQFLNLLFPTRIENQLILVVFGIYLGHENALSIR